MEEEIKKHNYKIINTNVQDRSAFKRAAKISFNEKRY